MDEFLDLSVRGRKTRYREKDFTANGVYHVFHRREDARVVFRDDADRDKFVETIKRLLAPQEFRDGYGRSLTPLPGRLSLYAFCVLSNHFHLALRQFAADDVVSCFMQRLLSSYTRYFNRRHGTTGPLFDQPYQCVPVTSSRHLTKLIAYIHANPPAPLDYAWSGHRYYTDHVQRAANPWCAAGAGLKIYGSQAAYSEAFLQAVADRAQRT